jgi:FkbM family methyltransferase
MDLNFDFYNASQCIDLGAHHGAFAFAIASIGIPTIAIEADPKNYSFLMANKAANSSLKIECIHAAVVSSELATRSKFTEFFVGNSPTTGSAKPMHKSQKLSSGIAVPNISLTDLFQLSPSSLNNENIILKVDVEGSEWLFFEDLIDTLKSGRVAILLGEFHDCDYEGQKYLIIESLKTLGWSYAVRDNNNGTLEIAAAPKKYCHN